MPAEWNKEIVNTIESFLREVGIAVKRAPVDDDTFLPGIDVVQGALIIDESKLLYPGDLLHEAGHLAVVPETLRNQLSGKVEAPSGNADVIEAAAISWSYAASVHLGLDPRIVFHEHGYHGRSESLLLGFQLGVFPGLHELVSSGMTLSGPDAERQQLRPFPAMQKWLRN